MRCTHLPKKAPESGGEGDGGRWAESGGGDGASEVDCWDAGDGNEEVSGPGGREVGCWDVGGREVDIRDSDRWESGI
jgi:hypothetical protein